VKSTCASGGSGRKLGGRGVERRPHLDLGDEGVDGGGQLLDLLGHLLLALLQPADHLVESLHALLQVLHLQQAVDAERGAVGSVSKRGVSRQRYPPPHLLTVL